MNWISVKDRVPEKDQECLTWDGRFMYIEHFDYMLDEDACFSQSGTSVTHWMRLPQPPDSMYGKMITLTEPLVFIEEE